MTSNRPYLIRALYEWIIDNDQTPYLLINSGHDQVVVPEQFAGSSRIVLNIAPQAVEKLELGNDWILFSARFDGRQFNVQVPIDAIISIYAKENENGMIFPMEESPKIDLQREKVGKDKAKLCKVPHLKVVK